MACACPRLAPTARGTDRRRHAGRCARLMVCRTPIARPGHTPICKATTTIAVDWTRPMIGRWPRRGCSSRSALAALYPSRRRCSGPGEQPVACLERDRRFPPGRCWPARRVADRRDELVSSASCRLACPSSLSSGSNYATRTSSLATGHSPFAGTRRPESRSKLIHTPIRLSWLQLHF